MGVWREALYGHVCVVCIMKYTLSNIFCASDIHTKSILVTGLTILLIISCLYSMSVFFDLFFWDAFFCQHLCSFSVGLSLFLLSIVRVYMNFPCDPWYNFCKESQIICYKTLINYLSMSLVNLFVRVFWCFPACKTSSLVDLVFFLLFDKDFFNAQVFLRCMYSAGRQYVPSWCGIRLKTVKNNFQLFCLLALRLSKAHLDLL